MKTKKAKIKGCACYGVNAIHPCFCSPFSNKNVKKQKSKTKKKTNMKTQEEK